MQDNKNRGVVDAGPQPGQPVTDDAGAAGVQQVRAAVARGSFTPEVAAAILRSNPADVAKIVQMLQQNFGNGFVQQAMAHAGAEPHGDNRAPTGSDNATSTSGGPPHKAQAGDKAPGVETEQLSGSLWAKDAMGADQPPSIKDLSQGQVGDCFLFATMGAIVHSNADLIKNMIVDHGDRTYTVTFKGTGIFSADKQTVSADFLKGKHGDVVKGRQALWPLIIEKAYAKEIGGMNKLDQGGNPGDAVEQFTNHGAEDFDPHDKPMAWVLARLNKAQKDKRPTTITSPGKEDGSAAKLEMSKKVKYLHFHHAYTVIDVDPAGQRVKLFNPWGYEHPGDDGWVNMMVIMNFFVEVDIN